MHFNIRALEYLNALSRYGSLRKASRMMNVDPATMSRMISQLEDVVSMPVWERANLKNPMTSAGIELLNYYRTLVANENAVYSRLQELKSLKRGRVRIAIGEGFINDLISKPMQQFMTTYPGIQLSIETAGAADAVRLLEDQQIDFAVTYASAPHPKLFCHIERSHPLDIIVPSGHPLLHESSLLSMQEISRYPLALIDGSTGMGRLVKHAEQISHVNLEPRLRTNSVSALKSYVSSGIGMTFMPRLTVIDEINDGVIQVIKPQLDVFAQAKARVLSLKGRELTIQATTLMDFLIRNTHFLHSDAPEIKC